MDSAEIFRPDPVSTHFIPESNRFDKNFDNAEKNVRNQKFDNQQKKIINLRLERLEREKQRFDRMDSDF